MLVAQNKDLAELTPQAFVPDIEIFVSAPGTFVHFAVPAVVENGSDDGEQ